LLFSDDGGAAGVGGGGRGGDGGGGCGAAGGDMVLTVSPATLPAMFDALYDRAARDPAFRARVDRSAERVVLAKQRLGLVAPNG
jgi:beta-N-acetylhexosaminidase